jgi:hypothetical protein
MRECGEFYCSCRISHFLCVRLLMRGVFSYSFHRKEENIAVTKARQEREKMKAEEKKKRLEKQHEDMKKESEMISKQLGDSRDWRSDRRDIRDDRSRPFGIDPRSRVRLIISFLLHCSHW